MTPCLAETGYGNQEVKDHSKFTSTRTDRLKDRFKYSRKNLKFSHLLLLEGNGMCVCVCLVNTVHIFHIYHSVLYEIAMENLGVKCSTLLHFMLTSLLGGHYPHFIDEKVKVCGTLVTQLPVEGLPFRAPPSLTVNWVDQTTHAQQCLAHRLHEERLAILLITVLITNKRHTSSLYCGASSLAATRCRPWCLLLEMFRILLVSGSSVSNGTGVAFLSKPLRDELHSLFSM